jgi:hypothetical protein
MHLIRSRFTRTVVLLAGVSWLGVACNDTSAPVYATGTVTVTVTDTNNNDALGVQVNLMLTDQATLWRTAVTDSDGNATFGTEDGGVVLVQNYLVYFPGHAQYTLALGETNYKPVTAIENQTVNVNLKVAKIVINPG